MEPGDRPRQHIVPISDENELWLGRAPELERLEHHFRTGQRLAVVRGEAGTGKTSLARMLFSRVGDAFPGGMVSLYAIADVPLTEAFEDTAARQGKARRLLIVDEAELGDALIPEVSLLMKRDPMLGVLIVGRRPPSLQGALVVDLGPLGGAEAAELARRAGVPEAHRAELIRLARGRPQVILIVADLLSRGTPWRGAVAMLGPMRYAGILGPDGRPLGSPSDVPAAVVTVASWVNDQVLRHLHDRPDEILRLPSRSFEELVAELLSRQGYEVELTPPSGDGGFDIFAARHSEFGRFLFLVECKRYVPPNKVGVEIVRSLHGVAQAQRATAGVVVTSSFFTRGAEEFRAAVEHQLYLRDYVGLQEWLSSVWARGRQ